jgi:hypothetical protein
MPSSSWRTPRAVTDLGAGTIVAVDFADGVRMNLKEP